MRSALAVLGTAALIIFTVPAVHASPVDAAVQSVADGQVAYAKKGGWHGGGKGWKHGKGGHGWGHHRGWRRGPPPWAPAWGWRRRLTVRYRQPGARAEPLKLRLGQPPLPRTELDGMRRRGCLG